MTILLALQSIAGVFYTFTTLRVASAIKIIRVLKRALLTVYNGFEYRKYLSLKLLKLAFKWDQQKLTMKRQARVVLCPALIFHAVREKAFIMNYIHESKIFKQNKVHSPK